MKKKTLSILTILSIIVFACLGTSLAIEKQNNKFNLLFGNVEAFSGPEGTPGNYTGAINTNCKRPSGTRGCKNDPDPKRVCTYSDFCIK